MNCSEELTFGSEADEIHDLAVEVMCDVLMLNASHFTLLEIRELMEATQPGSRYSQESLDDLFALRQRKAVELNMAAMRPTYYGFSAALQISNGEAHRIYYSPQYPGKYDGLPTAADLDADAEEKRIKAATAKKVDPFDPVGGEVD